LNDRSQKPEKTMTALPVPFAPAHLACLLATTLAAALAACDSGSGSEPPGQGARTYQPESGVKTIRAGDIDLAYFESGSGPLVVLLHGFPDTPHTWDALRPRLVAAGYRTVAPFERGYAPSTIPVGDDYAVPLLGGDVIALIEALGEERAILIGHDWGASAAYAAANLQPERVARMVTLAIPHPAAFLKHPDAITASPHFAELSRPDAAGDLARDDFQGVADLYARWSPTWSVPDAELEPVKNTFTAPGCLAGALGYYRAFAAAPPDPFLFQKTSVRTLTFWGTTDGAGDQSVFADQADGFTIPVDVVEVAAGHFIHRERPDEVADDILRFLGEP
jgi:pimeloyl-ACP methyl ester carboxylesterase